MGPPTKRSYRIAWSCLLALTSLAAACEGLAGPAVTPEVTGTSASEPEAWLLGYDDTGVSLYDAATGESVDLSLPPLWNPEQDLRDLPSSGLLAVRISENQTVGADLNLAILRLPQGDILRRIPLFSDDLADWIRRDAGSILPDYELQAVRGAIAGRWFRARWSPDGRKVAFPAALQDTGTDLYVFDLLSDELRRLSDEVDQVAVLGWSPDGEWVLYSDAFGFQDESEYIPTMVRAVSVRTGEARQLFEPISGFPIMVVGWSSPDDVILASVDAYDGVMGELVQVNLVSGQAIPLYERVFRSVDLDPASGSLALTQTGDAPDGGGAAIIKELGEAPGLVSDPWGTGSWGSVRWSSEVGAFFAESDSGVLAFNPDGEPVASFEYEGCLPLPSADGRWLAFGACQEGLFARPGLRIYTTAGESVREIEADFVVAMVWAPGSNGVYYTTYRDDGLALVWAGLPDGDARVLDRDGRSSLTLVHPSEAERQLVGQLSTLEATATLPATQFPTSTPARALDPDGPWLVGISRNGPVAMNPDGTGRTELFADVAASSPADWLASEISSAGWVAAVIEGTEAQPRTLVVGRPGMGIVREIPILTPDLQAEKDQLDENGEPKEWTEDVFLALDGDGWMDTLSWSPDGRTVAYLAAVDGPSADLYVYDTAADEVRRLTDGPNQPRLLGWSADGRWILHLEIRDIRLGDGIWWDTLGLWAAAADGSEVRKVPGVEQRLVLVHWGLPTQFLMVHYENGPLPPYRLELVDLEAGPVATLYPASVYRWAVDPGTSTIAFVVDPDVDQRAGGLEAGLYLASPSQQTPQLVGKADPDREPYLGYSGGPVWSPEFEAFMVATRENEVVLVSSNGEILRRIEDACHMPVPSPDRRWLAFEPCSRMAFGIEVRSEDDGTVRDLHLGTISDFFWTPDSSGIYYFQGEHPDPEQLMYVPIPEGAPRLIHPDSGLRGGAWRPQFVWGDERE